MKLNHLIRMYGDLLTGMDNYNSEGDFVATYLSPEKVLINKSDSENTDTLDYSREGLCFVTICCYDRFCYFGHIDIDAMILNQYGQIAFDEWMKLPERYPNF